MEPPWAVRDTRCNRRKPFGGIKEADLVDMYLELAGQLGLGFLLIECFLSDFRLKSPNREHAARSFPCPPFFRLCQATM
jgi:hypothetical protein